MKAIFTSDYRYGYINSNSDLYRPLSKAMFAVEWQLSPNNPTIHHFMNVLLYALCCVLLFIVLVRVTKLNVYVLFAMALLYAAHPIHTEVVANIKSRDEILSMLFILLSLLCLWRYIETKKARSLILYLFCFFLALLSKESAMVHVALAPLVVYFFSAAETKRIVQITLYAAVTGIVFMLIHHAVLGTIGLSNIPVIDNSLMVTNSFFERRATAILILGKYLLLLIFPHPLSSDYSFNTIPIVTSIANAGFLLALLVHGGMLIYAIMKWKEKKFLAFCILFYLVSMSIASNIFMIIGTHLAERLLFFPSVAFCMAAVYGLCRLFKINVDDKEANSSLTLPIVRPVLAICIAVALLYSVKTVSRNKDWRSNTTLFTKDIETVPNSAHMLMYTADYLSNVDTLATLSKEEQNARLLHAQRNINKALSIYSLFPDAYYLSGRIWYHLGNYQEAYNSYNKAMSLNPGRELYHSNVGSSLFALGRYQEAAQEFERSQQLNPQDPDAPFNTGSAYGAMGEAYRQHNDMANAQKMFGIAIDNFKKAVAMKPDYKAAYKFLGTTYMNIGDTLNGNANLQKAEQLK